MKTFHVLILSLASWGSAGADGYSGADLQRFIEASQAVSADASGAVAVNAGVYAGYLAGITEAFKGIYFCPPDEIGLREMAAVVAGHLHDHPEKIQQPAQALITRALGDAYPCRFTSSRR